MDFLKDGEGYGEFEIYASLSALLKSGDLTRLLGEAAGYAEKYEKKRNYDFVSGFCAIAGWCNYKLGENEADIGKKTSYCEASRTWMEKALMAVPELVPRRKDFATRVLLEANRFLRKKEKEKLAGSYLSEQNLMVLEQFHKLEQGIELYRTLRRTEAAGEPVERSILLLKLGNEYLNMGWSGESGNKERTAADLACERWKEIVNMHKNGAKIYPNVLFIAIRGVLNHDPEITDHEAEELYDLGLRQIDFMRSRQRDSKWDKQRFRREDFYAAIRRMAGPARDPFLGIII